MIDSRERAKRFKDARKIYNIHGKQVMNEVYEATKETCGNGVQTSMITDLENPAVDRPVQYQKVMALAEHYGVNVAWLMGQSDSPSLGKCCKQIVSEYTGLSDDIINILNEINNKGLSNELNKFIETKFIYLVLEKMLSIEHKRGEAEP